MKHTSKRPILHHLLRRVVAPVMIAGLVLSVVAPAPAVAKDRDAQDANALLLSLLGAAAIGAIIIKNSDGRTDSYVTHERNRHVPKHGSYSRRGYDDRRMELPRKCLRRFETQFGVKKYWAKRCLKRRFDFAQNLPRHCKDRIVARNHEGIYVTRKVYRPRCLKREGYRKERLR